ncbi:probable endonuclease [gamma proteobacterium HdN1]|nr:probable endonuclease [gamma proteobacterium HdN1]
MPSLGLVLKASKAAPNKSQHLHASVRGRRCAPPVCSALCIMERASDMSQIEHAFALAKKVFSGEMTQQGAANHLHKVHKINVNSAKIMIAVYGRMVRGLEFKRALSAPDMNYYLATFLAEGGPGSLKNPVKALWEHIEYYEAKNSVNLNALRDLYATYSAVSEGFKSAEDIQGSFQKAVEAAAKVPIAERQNLLKSFGKLPRTRPVVSLVYERNPYVVVEVLNRAKGMCERCKSQAPFKRRKDNTPYLEVHHRVRLADGGEDTVENAVALCPNCHRLLHFGRAEA